jgi:hypothetical protein
LSGKFGRSEVKLSFTWSVSVFTIQVVKVFCYINGFSNDMQLVGPDVGYELCSIEVSAVFSLNCGVLIAGSPACV